MSLRILRLCSVFEPDGDQVARPGYDPIGGMQNHTASLTRALDARGVQQTVITSRLGGPAGRAPFGRHAELVRVGLPVPRLRQLWAASAARIALRRGPVDVVHAHQGEDLAALPLAAAAARRLGAPLVVTLHCSLRYSVPSAGVRLTALRVVGGALEHRLLGHADEIIALTDTTARQLTGDARPVTVIPSGFDPLLFGSAAPSELLAGIPGPRVVYLGRLARQKDVPTLVRAFGLLRSPASLVIVGDGPDRPAVDAAVAGLTADVAGRVHRFGFRPHEEVPNLLAAADLLVLPSIYEEMGSVLVEAMQAGVPVVASDVGGIPDVVADEVTGLLVPPQDPARLAAALDRLLAAPDLLALMGAAARRRSQRYSWDELAGRVSDVYSAALAARRCTRASASATASMP